MSRALRIEFPGAIYHMMARGVAQMPVFFDDGDRLALLYEIANQVRLGVLIVHAFCLMLNHIHLLCETPYSGLGRIMHDILGSYASNFNRLHKRSGHLWQGRYKAILVQDGQYMLNCSRYIHLNPFKAGIDTADFTYPWSSYQSYLHNTSFPWVCTDRILSRSNTPKEYQEFVENQIEDCANPFELATAGFVYGDQEFVKGIYQIVHQTGIKGDDQPVIRSLRKAVSVPSINAVRSAVEAAFPDHAECQKRRFLVWALHSYTWLKGSEIGRTVGLKRSAVSRIISSFEHMILVDEIMAKSFGAVARQLEIL